MRTAILALIAAGTPALAQFQIVDDIPGAFVDISGIGIPLAIPDDGVVPFISTVGNSVFPAGVIQIGNNGGVGFGPGALPILTPANSTLPSPNAFGGALSILPFWDDEGSGSGAVYVFQDTTTLIIQWNRPFNTGGFGIFQAQVSSAEDRRYTQFLYQDIESPSALGGEIASIGFQGGSLFDSVTWSVNQAFAVQNGTVLTLTDLPAPGSAAALAAGLLGIARRRR